MIRHSGTLVRMAALGATLAGSSTIAAQPAVLDAGTFTITGGTQVLGREQFSVVRAPPGAAWSLELRVDAARGDSLVAFRLQVDSSGRPVNARRESRTAGRVVARATGAQSRGRFATLWRDGQHEAAREHRLARGTVLLDPSVVHAALLAVQALARDSVAGVVTLDGRPTAVLKRVAAGVNDSLRIGGRWLDARRTDALWAGNALRLWTDTAGRLLAVDGLRTGERALRDDPPESGPR
ncbi:MAG: hypothetical protein MUE41_06570 [Gemmatimonadaceae bacterium]|jgi:hypothetical protein|nr:hypothetical protein [Gemmatimonadaceae bacterium]